MSERSFVSYVSDPAFYADPYPVYKALREQDPIQYTPLRGGTWLFTSYADVAAGLRDERLSNARTAYFMASLPPESRGEFTPLADTLSRWLLFYDPPRHTRLRKLLGRAFSQSSIEHLRVRIDRVVNELLDEAMPEGRFDVIARLAFQVPILVIVEMLGVPAARRQDFIVWSGDLARLLGGATPDLQTARRAQQSIQEMTEFLRGQVAERRKNPSDDILTTLINAEEDGDTLDEAELYAQCVMLLFAGHETTRNLIGNGLHALLTNPRELQRVRAEPSLLKPAIEELLRYDSPVQMLSRVVTQDFDYKGRQIKKGQLAMLFMGAGNRDPEVFERPDTLDLGRKDIRHLSFAVGPHLCLGAGLARLETQIALGTLLERAPRLRLAEPQPEYVMNLVLRGLKHLWVEF